MLKCLMRRARNVGRCCPRYGDHVVNENGFDKNLLILTHTQETIQCSLKPKRSDTRATSLVVLDLCICALSSCSVCSCVEVTVTHTQACELHHMSFLAHARAHTNTLCAYFLNHPRPLEFSTPLCLKIMSCYFFPFRIFISIALACNVPAGSAAFMSPGGRLPLRSWKMNSVISITPSSSALILKSDAL